MMMKTTLALPPMLAQLHVQLIKSQTAGNKDLRKEIESVSEALEYARTLDPDHPAIVAVSRPLDEGFTGEKPTVCGCCGRPF